MSNIFCNCCGGEQMKVGYNLTFCLLILFLTPADKTCFLPSMCDKKIIYNFILNMVLFSLTEEATFFS